MKTNRPLVTVVLPCYNEAAALSRNLGAIYDYLATLASKFCFEVLIVNDGSRDDTARVAEAARQRHPDLQVIHHPTNFGLGQAFKTAFAASRGDYVVTLDADLSYAPETIGQMLDALIGRSAKLVLASAYMPGGRVTNVPRDRHLYSRVGNRLMSLMDSGRFSTYTCMVRAYDGPFIRSLEPRAHGMGIMPEIIYKTLILGGRIVEVPAHLDWSLQLQDAAAAKKEVGAAPSRRSSMRVITQMLSTSVSSFLFRPFMLMLVPGLLLLLFSGYVNFWLLIELIGAYERTANLGGATALVYAEHPATMLVGMLTLVLSIQLISLGAMSMQNKRYYEETYFQLFRLRRQLERIEEGAREPGASADAGAGARRDASTAASRSDEASVLVMPPTSSRHDAAERVVDPD